MSTVNEKDLTAVLKWVRDLRAFCVVNSIDPWATRQGLIMALEMDTKAAMDRGVSKQDLEKFDTMVIQDIKSWMRAQFDGCVGNYG